MCAKVVKIDKHNNLACLTHVKVKRLKCWSHECGSVTWRGRERKAVLAAQCTIFVQYYEIFTLDKFSQFSLCTLFPQELSMYRTWIRAYAEFKLCAY